MKKCFLPFLVASDEFVQPACFFSAKQSRIQHHWACREITWIFMPYMDLFQKSKTIEDFEKKLNEEKTGINNLDLDLDKKVDFIKVVTKKEG